MFLRFSSHFVTVVVDVAVAVVMGGVGDFNIVALVGVFVVLLMFCVYSFCSCLWWSCS